MSRHRFGSPGDHALFGGAAAVLGIGLVASAWIPGAEDAITRGLVGLVVLVALGWLARQVLGELLLTLELHRAPREPRAGWRTCMVRARVDPRTGRPWRESETEGDEDHLRHGPRAYRPSA